MAGGSSDSDDVGAQAWPGFVDIMASTVLVLCFALLVMVLLLSMTKITSSGKNKENGSPSALKIESDVLGEYRAEFQKLAIVANPSLSKNVPLQSDNPTSEDTSSVPYYVPSDAKPVDEPQDVTSPGEDRREVLGDTPKALDSKSLEVLKELIIVQRDVIDQQRKVIEQRNTEVVKSVKEYQSLLSLITNAKDVEDIRQKINPKDLQALFPLSDTDGERLTGEAASPQGNGNYVLNPTSISTASVKISNENGIDKFTFSDNASFLSKQDYDSIKEELSKRVSDINSKGVILSSKVTDFALSGTEGARIAVDRLLIFRSLLIELGISPTAITLKTLRQNDDTDDEQNDQKQEEDYGWISVEAKN